MIQSPPRASRDLPLLPAGPTLARLLAARDGVPAAAPTDAFVVRLGRWFEWRDAIALSAALNSRPGAAPGPVGVDDVGREARRVRARLDGLARDPVAATRSGRSPRALSAEPADADLAARRQRHVAAQREMASCIAALRQRLRDALAQASPALAQLAALDVVMERVVGAREHLLLADLAHRLDAHDLPTVLRAELDLRWQPVEALLGALQPSP